VKKFDLVRKFNSMDAKARAANSVDHREFIAPDNRSKANFEKVITSNNLNRRPIFSCVIVLRH
jgi:hypothetical protein